MTCGAQALSRRAAILFAMLVALPACGASAVGGPSTHPPVPTIGGGTSTTTNPGPTSTIITVPPTVPPPPTTCSPCNNSTAPPPPSTNKDGSLVTSTTVAPTTTVPTSTTKPASTTVATTKPPTTYTVQSGDTLASIAAKVGVSQAALIQANPRIQNNDHIETGWVLTIPGH